LLEIQVSSRAFQEEQLWFAVGQIAGSFPYKPSNSEEGEE